ncbi:MAG: WbqC family protein [Bacteroidales bacterium]|mgnify:FL=1|jgi:hypothetical protein|nr:WbqC family protein [Bacteroidales bacterium]MDD4395115.1 WbqC family protein [Bacteroidales bacterium]
MNEGQIILSTAYLPPIEYFAFINESEVFFLEGAEHYQKQSYRNRANIMTGNGVQSLIIPVVHQSSKMMIRDVRIDYKNDWQRQHWKTIESAYNNSPFFLYFQDYLFPFYQKKYPFLFDYNLEIISILLKLLRIKKDPVITASFEMNVSIKDLRNEIHPKREIIKPRKAYSQVFEDKYSFVPNLSVIDYLFNLGTSEKFY